MTDERNAVNAEAAPALPAPAAGGRRNDLAIAAIVIAVVALVLAGSVPLWLPLLAAKNGDDQRLAAASAALAAQETRIAQLEARVKQLASVPDPAPALAALGDRVGTLERKPDTSAATADAVAQIRRDTAAAAARLDDVESRLTRLAAAQAQGPSSDRMLLLAVEELRADVTRSGPFAGALAATEALARGNDDATAALAPLEAWAASGIPSAAVLAHQFTADIAPAIERADVPTAPSDDWEERILAELRKLVVIRRADDSGDPAAAAVTHAEAALAKDDLAGAVAAVKSLSGAPAAAAAPWLDAADHRLAAEDALGRVTQLAAAKIGEAGH